MKLGRFIIDSHVHAQRHAAGPEFKKLGFDDPKKIKYKDLARVMRHLKTYDNSKRLLYDMKCYDVDMCILHPAFGMSNEINMELVEKYPDKFRALASPKETADKALAGEIEWSMEAAVEELDRLLSTGKFIGTGEGMPANPGGMGSQKTISQTERMDDLRLVMNLARKHEVPVRVHTGSPMGYPITYTFWPENFHPSWIRDLAAEYPDVPIVFDHGGMQGGRWDNLVEECIQVAANHDNVYLETGLYWTELYYKALEDPNVGPEKLMWGTDWGASIPPIQTQLGLHPQTYGAQVHKEGIVRHQVDIMGWSLKQVMRLNISQDDMNLILSGNALRVYKIDFPLATSFPRTLIRPAVKVTSSRSRVKTSHPAFSIAGVTNFVRISCSLSDFLSIISCHNRGSHIFKLRLIFYKNQYVSCIFILLVPLSSVIRISCE